MALEPWSPGVLECSRPVQLVSRARRPYGSVLAAREPGVLSYRADKEAHCERGSRSHQLHAPRLA